MILSGQEIPKIFLLYRNSLHDTVCHPKGVWPGATVNEKLHSAFGEFTLFCRERKIVRLGFFSLVICPII